MVVSDIAEEDGRRASDVLPEFLQSGTAALLLNAKSRFWWDGPAAVKDFYREEMKKNLPFDKKSLPLGH